MSEAAGETIPGSTFTNLWLPKCMYMFAIKGTEAVVNFPNDC